MKKIINWLRIRKWRKIIKESGMFDEKYYLFTYPDVRNKDIDPITHFLVYAAKEKRNPSLGFDTSFYLESNNDVATKKINPLLHYILHGKQEKRAIKKENIITVAEIKFKPLQFPNFKTPSVSIIIPVYNQFHYTYACLSSILKSTTETSYEIIIADDLSTDKTVDIEKICKNIQVIHNTKNLGFLLNCNNAANYARGKYIHFLNNDTQVKENWLSSLVELIESDKKIGMVGSKLVYPDGRLQEAGGIIWNDATGWNYGRLDIPAKPEYNYVKEVDYISGASIMIKTDLWNDIGGFDERYVPAYFEDSDLAFEVRKHGYKVLYQPKSTVVHFEGISHGTDISLGVKKHQVKNKEKFISKWKETLKKQFKNAQDIFLARDRSKGKPTILIIDHYVPHFDQDAGSRTVFGYIKLFISGGYSVKFIGDNYYPHQPYTEILENLGVEVLYGNWYTHNWKKWLQINGKYFDYVFMNRPHITDKYIDHIKKCTNSKILYYGHDLHFLREKREYELTANSDKLISSKYWRNKELEIMKKADISLYPSEFEVNAIKEIDSRIKVFSIPAYLYENFINSNRDIEQTSNIMFVGGFAHTPNIDAIMWFVKEIYPIIKEKIPSVKLYIIGSKPTKKIMSLNSDDIIVTGYISDDELKNYYKKTRIAVIPLRYGAGIKGKLVEALYNEIPIVTTSVGAEGLSNIDNCICINNTAKDFAESVVQIYNNVEKLKAYSHNSLKYCQNNFSYKVAIKKLKEILNYD